MHRLFIAIRLPHFVSDLLLDTMEGLPSLRWQDEDQLHLTLRFIGEVDQPLANDLAAALGARLDGGGLRPLLRLLRRGLRGHEGPGGEHGDSGERNDAAKVHARSFRRWRRGSC